MNYSKNVAGAPRKKQQMKLPQLKTSSNTTEGLIYDISPVVSAAL